MSYLIFVYNLLSLLELSQIVQEAKVVNERHDL